jgi:RNA polymerase sigma-70 factor (ECF subfamily)
MIERDPVVSIEQWKEDRALVRAALRGEARAIDDLLERLELVPQILASANRRMDRPLGEHDLADLAQDTLIGIWQKLDTFEGRARLDTWVYRFCFLEYMNRMRKKGRQTRVVGMRIDAVEGAVAPHEASPGEFEGLNRGLVELGPPGADVIRMKHFENRTFREIGEILEIPANTVKTHYYRGIAWLREYLTRHEGEAR